jgi:hypothetical protein
MSRTRPPWFYGNAVRNDGLHCHSPLASLFSRSSPSSYPVPRLLPNTGSPTGTLHRPQARAPCIALSLYTGKGAWTL